MSRNGIRTTRGRVSRQSDPPGKTKLVAALRHLLKEKDFNSVTTAEIASTAATNEALIYRYFGDKRGLLHQVLAEYLEEMLETIKANSEGIDSPVQRLEQLIFDTLDIYNRYRVFAKIVLMEVRCFPGYFESATYQLVRRYARLYVDVVKEAIAKGEFRNDVNPARVRDAILGMIEQVTMPAVIFGKSMDAQAYTKTICDVVFYGIATNRCKWTPAASKELDTAVSR